MLKRQEYLIPKELVNIEDDDIVMIYGDLD